MTDAPQWKEVKQEDKTYTVFYDNHGKIVVIDLSLLAQVQKEAEHRGRHLERVEQMGKAIFRMKKGAE